jgi:hypothetical protein
VSSIMGGGGATGMIVLARRGLPTQDQAKLLGPEEGRISLADKSAPV